MDYIFVVMLSSAYITVLETPKPVQISFNDWNVNANTQD